MGGPSFPLLISRETLAISFHLVTSHQPSSSHQSATERSAENLFRTFKKCNQVIFWNLNVGEALQSCSLSGYIHPHILLINAPEPSLTTLATAWKKCLLRSPKGYSIDYVATLKHDFKAQAVAQCEALPLEEVLCYIIFDLSCNEETSGFQEIYQRLQLWYRGNLISNTAMSDLNLIPPPTLVQQSLAQLMQEGIIYATAQGYGIFTSNNAQILSWLSNLPPSWPVYEKLSDLVELSKSQSQNPPTEEAMNAKKKKVLKKPHKKQSKVNMGTGFVLDSNTKAMQKVAFSEDVKQGSLRKTVSFSDLSTLTKENSHPRPPVTSQQQHQYAKLHPSNNVAKEVWPTSTVPMNHMSYEWDILHNNLCTTRGPNPSFHHQMLHTHNNEVNPLSVPSSSFLTSHLPPNVSTHGLRAPSSQPQQIYDQSKTSMTPVTPVSPIRSAISRHHNNTSSFITADSGYCETQQNFHRHGKSPQLAYPSPANNSSTNHFPKANMAGKKSDRDLFYI